MNTYQVWFVRGTMYEVQAADANHAIEIVKSENKECWYWDLLKVVLSDTKEILVQN